MSEPKFIVAEVSKGWLNGQHAGELSLLSTRFEEVINVHWEHGYRLVDWRLNQVAVVGAVTEQTEMTETIIAVFKKRI